MLGNSPIFRICPVLPKIWSGLRGSKLGRRQEGLQSHVNKHFWEPAHWASHFWDRPTPGTPLAFADGGSDLQSAWSGFGGIPEWPGLSIISPWLVSMSLVGWLSLVVPGKMASSHSVAPRTPDSQRHAGNTESYPCHITWGLGDCSKVESSLPLLICPALLIWAFYFPDIIWSFSLSLELDESFKSAPTPTLLQKVMVVVRIAFAFKEEDSWLSMTQKSRSLVTSPNRKSGVRRWLLDVLKLPRDA